MKTNIKTLLCAAGVLALTACSEGTMAEFYGEAGAEVDEGGFGNPTMNNTLAQLAERCIGAPKGYIVPDSVVVLDPGSPAGAPRYRRAQVRCTGELDGKYANVIYANYVASAVPKPAVQDANAQ